MRSDSNNYIAKAQITAILYKNYEELIPLDSVSTPIYHSKTTDEGELLGGVLEMKVPKGERYIVEVLVADINRNLQFRYVENIDKRSEKSRQNFALIDQEGFLKFPGNLCSSSEVLRLQHRFGDNVNMHVRYYNRDFPIAMPPYSMVNETPFNFKPDSSFSYLAGSPIVLNKRGFYHFQIDSNSYFGYSIFAFADGYPELVKVEQLVQPLRYLTTNREYEELTTSNNPKKSVDAFWLKIGGSEERARVLLRTYYERVQDANKYFTSYLPGWKTDRGMIYCVFGPPNIIFRSSGGERWIYGQESSSLSYTFQFARVDNPFTENDYSLSRSTIYRYTWAQAVDTWRQGRVYNVNMIRRDQEQEMRSADPSWYWN